MPQGLDACCNESDVTHEWMATLKALEGLDPFEAYQFRLALWAAARALGYEPLVKVRIRKRARFDRRFNAI